MRATHTDYDNPWQEVLTRYFPDFLVFFFPVAHADIDWTRPHVFLDKELRQVTPAPPRPPILGVNGFPQGWGGGGRFQVWRGDGAEAWVLVHVEVQSQEDAAFAERMYVYNYRLFDRYRRRVASLAVLGDERGRVGGRGASGTNCGAAKSGCGSRR